MKTICTIQELQHELNIVKTEGRIIGLVPTMGALHKGHLSLVERARKDCNFLIVTIFVNPTQFNDPDDLKKYPRTFEQDAKMLEKLPVDIIFAPEASEMYPEKDTRSFDLAPLDKVMEGKFRPGHFNGVAQIVSKLFYATNPDIAFFGQKDFQQLSIIRLMTKQLNLDIEIVGCPIIRESDGLAMSSRNQRLSPEERFAVPQIYQQLSFAKEKQNDLSPSEIIKMVKNAIDLHPLMNVEYFEIVDDQSLMPINDWKQNANKVGCIAVQLNRVRLIDNIYFD